MLVFVQFTFIREFLIMLGACDRVRVPGKQDITMACIIYSLSGAPLGRLFIGVLERA